MSSRAGARGGANIGSQTTDPLCRWKLLSRAVADSLDPSKAPGKVRAFKDMTPEEQAAMRALYERKP